MFSILVSKTVKNIIKDAVASINNIFNKKQITQRTIAGVAPALRAEEPNPEAFKAIDEDLITKILRTLISEYSLSKIFLNVNRLGSDH